MKTKSTLIRSKDAAATPAEAQPLLNQRGAVIQAPGALVFYPLALSEEARRASVEALNQVLADSIYLREMYKKHHWQVTGPTFRELHRLYDKYFRKQDKLIDMIGERVQTLGGIAVAMPDEVAEMTKIERPPCGREQVPVQISRLLEGLAVLLAEEHRLAQIATESGDDGTADLMTSHVIPSSEKQVWVLSQHLVDTPLVRAR